MLLSFSLLFRPVSLCFEVMRMFKGLFYSSGIHREHHAANKVTSSQSSWSPAVWLKTTACWECQLLWAQISFLNGCEHHEGTCEEWLSSWIISFMDTEVPAQHFLDNSKVTKRNDAVNTDLAFITFYIF